MLDKLTRDDLSLVNLSKKNKLNEVEVKYGHSTILVRPSVSFQVGIGISFSKAVEEIGITRLRCYR